MNEIIGLHLQLNGHEFEEAQGDSEEQGSLACCSPWCCKELDTPEQLNNNQGSKSRPRGEEKVLVARIPRSSQEHAANPLVQAFSTKFLMGIKLWDSVMRNILIIGYGCESWTIKKAECQRVDAFELCCWRRFLRVPWTARRSNQSVLKEINPEYSLERLRLKLKL